MSSTFLQPSSLKSKIELIEVMLHKFKSQNASVEIDLWLQISSEHFFALSDFLDHESQDGVFFGPPDSTLENYYYILWLYIRIM